MAKLKAFVEKLEDVPEDQRDLYVEDTDHEGNKRFKLDAEGLEDVGGLKVVNADLKKKLSTARQRAALLDDVDESEVENIITAGKAELERQKSGKARDDVENVKKQMTTAHEKEKVKLQRRLDAALAALGEEAIENKARAELAAPEIKGNATMLLPHIKGVAKIVEIEDGDEIKFETRVIDPKTKKERVDGKGEPIGIKALVAEISENAEFSGAFEGTGASGSGTPAEGSSGTPSSPRSDAGTKASHKTAKQRTGDYAI